MQISNKLFNQQQLSHFGKLNKDIQHVQNKMASGKDILKASDDPLVLFSYQLFRTKRSCSANSPLISQLRRVGLNKLTR